MPRRDHGLAYDYPQPTLRQQRFALPGQRGIADEAIHAARARG
jgi:hypothetical protein